MKNRLGLALALPHAPELLVLDEPTHGLGPAGMRDVRALLSELAGQGVTVMLSSHLLHEVEQVCDVVVVLHEGRVVAHGAVRELLAGPAGTRVRVDEAAGALRALEGLPGRGYLRQEGDWVSRRWREVLRAHGWLCPGARLGIVTGSRQAAIEPLQAAGLFGHQSPILDKLLSKPVCA
jgi:ABC-type multidrug transport system ATPase subunit